MPQIIIETRIRAPLEACFDAARDIGLHLQTSAATRERAVAGRTSGLIELGESVTFEGVHFGVRQQFTARVTRFERPHFFTDHMTRGAFAAMRHTHQFEALPTGEILMRDVVQWRAPLGIVGRLADALFLRRHLRRFVGARGAALKRHLEAAKWQKGC